MTKLILLRHGQSEWNKRNLFTGCIDIPLSFEGIQEALEAGVAIQDIPIDLIFTSALARGISTALLALSRHGSGKTPVLVHKGGREEEWSRCYSPQASASLIPLITAWELNERMYGELQGLNKEECRQKFGAEQVQIWRRSYAVAPPGGESLKMTKERTLPYFHQTILPELKRGKNVLISAHGNSLRSIIMELDQLNEQEIVQLEIPTGKPLIYDYHEGNLSRLGYL